jgi:hypothetical protein
MGTTADDIVNGLQCSWCGTYFKEEHGYPVLCNDCYKHATKAEREEVQKSIYEEL